MVLLGTPGTCVCQETEVVVQDTPAPPSYNPPTQPPASSYNPAAQQRLANLILKTDGDLLRAKGPQRLAKGEKQQADEKSSHESLTGRVPPGVKVLAEDPVVAAPLPRNRSYDWDR